MSRAGGAARTHAVVTTLCALGALGTLAGGASASPLERALDYLSARQDPATGAVGPEVGRAADTAWTAMAAAGAAESPVAWTRGTGTLASAVGALPMDATSDLLRVAVARRAAGLVDADLAARVGAQQSADGSFPGGPIATAWGILAVRAVGRNAGDPALTAAVAALAAQRAPDGGWAATPGAAASDAVATATAIQALRAARMPVGDPVLASARARLLALRDPDGTFGRAPVPTAWAIMAIRSLGERPGAGPWARGGSPVAALQRFQQDDGGVRATPSSGASVFATAVAALAFSRGLLPVSPGTARTPDRAPRVVRRSPASGDVVRGVLSVRYEDERGGTGIDPSRTTIMVNGADITRTTRVTPFTLQVRQSALPLGTLSVSVLVRDRAGHATRSEWSVVGSG
ncbi:MAG: hypothetical protein FJW99_02060 [Actinobacteria bacterium]|nr:hypothetical protein [Actinomycetota bacterium]MBM3698017.1 hypothetical protein [Actinomycetota bacterium]